MRFFSEKDVHWLFCRRLERELVGSGVQEEVDQTWPTNIDRFSTSLIHQEYGTPQRGGERYDICLLPPDQVARIDGYELKIGKDYVRPLAIVEYTTERYGTFRNKKAGIERGNWVDKFAWDISKLRRSGAEHTYAELLYRVTTKTDEGSRRHMERYSPRLLSVLRRARSKASSLQVSANVSYLLWEKWEEL